MELIETGFSGLFLVKPPVYADNRGYFTESYNAQALLQLGLEANFVQDNQSLSTKGVLRGLHFQNAPHAQTKLVRVLSGSILDIVVDLRRDQPTFGKHFAVELSAESKQQLYVPKGFAHGFSVLSESAEILYKCDDYYYPNDSGGILYNDPALGIDWCIPEDAIILSEKDGLNPTLADATYKF